MTKNVKTFYNGELRLGNHIMISDPCYATGSWCHSDIEAMKPGKYSCYTVKCDAGSWGTRVMAIMIIYQNKPEYLDDSIPWQPTGVNIYVDSGQAGFYDYDYYKNRHIVKKNGDHIDGNWYRQVCNGTEKDNCTGAFINDKAFVTSSGYGDGEYAIYAKAVNDEVVAMKLVFINPTEEAED